MLIIYIYIDITIHVLIQLVDMFSNFQDLDKNKETVIMSHVYILSKLCEAGVHETALSCLYIQLAISNLRHVYPSCIGWGIQLSLMLDTYSIHNLINVVYLIYLLHISIPIRCIDLKCRLSIFYIFCNQLKALVCHINVQYILNTTCITEGSICQCFLSLLNWITVVMSVG